MDYLFQAFFKESHFFQTKKTTTKKQKSARTFLFCIKHIFLMSMCLHKTYISHYVFV